MKIRLGFGIGAWPFGERTAARFFDFVDRCEEWGVDSLWFSDRIVGPGRHAWSRSSPWRR